MKMATTVMIDHGSCQHAQDVAVAFLEKVDLRGKYDFTCVPPKATGRSSLGYMFVNCFPQEYMNGCKQLLIGQMFGKSKISTGEN